MYELKITAHTMTQLRERVTELAADMGVVVSLEYDVRLPTSVDVPLPEPRAEVENPKRKTKADKEAEAAKPEDAVDAEVEEIAPEPVNETAETEHVEADASNSATDLDTSHAAPGEVYLLDGDGYNNDKRRVTYKDGVRFSTVHKDSAHKHTVYTAHAPARAPHAAEGETYRLAGEELTARGRRILYVDGKATASAAKDEQDAYPEFEAHAPILDDGIPEHMRDDVGATSMDGLKDKLSGVEPYQEGDEVPEGILERPTSPEGSTVTEVAPDAEPEPATSEPATTASDDGAPTGEDSGPSAPAASDGPPPEYAAYIEAVSAADTWKAVKKAMRDFFTTEFFKALTPEKQNKVRAMTWNACLDAKADGSLTDLPDHADDMTAFRLWIETVDDPDAIIGTKVILERQEEWTAALALVRGNDAQKGSQAKALMENIDNAVGARLRALS